MEKGFVKLPNVRDLLSNIDERDSEFYFQGVKLCDLENAKDIVSKKKNYFAWLVGDCLLERLEREKERR